jgi:hypothetical protein
MENAGKLWTRREELQLEKLFCKYNMEIEEISEIHKRSIEGVKARLIKLGLVKEVKSSYINMLTQKIKDLELEVIELNENLWLYQLD